MTIFIVEQQSHPHRRLHRRLCRPFPGPIDGRMRPLVNCNYTPHSHIQQIDDQRRGLN